MPPGLQTCVLKFSYVVRTYCICRSTVRHDSGWPTTFMSYVQHINHSMIFRRRHELLLRCLVVVVVLLQLQLLIRVAPSVTKTSAFIVDGFVVVAPARTGQRCAAAAAAGVSVSVTSSSSSSSRPSRVDVLATTVTPSTTTALAMTTATTAATPWSNISKKESKSN